MLDTADGIHETTRQTMLKIISRSCDPVWPEVNTANFPSTQTITTCINLYYRHFHDWLQVLQISGAYDGAPLLVMAMSAIGSMYSPDGLQRLGVALNELVRRAVVFVVSSPSHTRSSLTAQGESDRRFMFEPHIIQAYLLQTYFGFFCGSHKSFQQAEASRGILILAYRRMHLLRPGVSAIQVLLARDPFADAQSLALADNEDRSKARLGWAIYVSEYFVES
jgi:hypothetical protein